MLPPFITRPDMLTFYHATCIHTYRTSIQLHAGDLNSFLLIRLSANIFLQYFDAVGLACKKTASEI